MTENLLQTNVVPLESEIKTLTYIAKTAQNSGLYSGVGGESKILMVLLAAHELGIKPMVALNGGIWNIQGKIEISARLMNAMIRKAGHSIRIIHCDENKCIIEGKRNDSGDTFSAQFTIEDAKKAGISGRTNWKAYAEDMLYARAMSRLARRLFPDIIGSAYVEGEIREAESLKPLKNENPDIEISAEKIEEENCEDKINELIEKYPDFNQEEIKIFLNKMKIHRRTSMSKIIEEFQDHNHFIKLYERFQNSLIQAK